MSFYPHVREKWSAQPGVGVGNWCGEGGKKTAHFFAIFGGINQTKTTSVGKFTNTAAKVARLQQKERVSGSVFFSLFFGWKGVKKCLLSGGEHTHAHTDYVCEVVITWAIIATATKVCHVTLSVPGLFHSTAQPFSFHSHNSRCPLYSSGPKVQHPHYPYECYRQRRSP